MSEEQTKEKNIFGLESGDQVRSPEKLNEFIRVSSTGTWLIVLALAVVLGAFLVWGFIGFLPVNCTVEAVGLTIGVDIKTADLSDPNAFEVHGALCFPDATKVTSHDIQNKKAVVVFCDGERVTGTAFLLDTTPETDKELEQLLDSHGANTTWVLSQLGAGNFRYPVYVYFDEPLDYLYWGEVGTASITIRQDTPIHFLFGEEN